MLLYDHKFAPKNLIDYLDELLGIQGLQTVKMPADFLRLFVQLLLFWGHLNLPCCDI
jgi:hypothetical protein